MNALSKSFVLIAAVLMISAGPSLAQSEEYNDSDTYTDVDESAPAKEESQPEEDKFSSLGDCCGPCASRTRAASTVSSRVSTSSMRTVLIESASDLKGGLRSHPLWKTKVTEINGCIGKVGGRRTN